MGDALVVIESYSEQLKVELTGYQNVLLVIVVAVASDVLKLFVIAGNNSQYVQMVTHAVEAEKQAIADLMAKLALSVVAGHVVQIDKNYDAAQNEAVAESGVASAVGLVLVTVAVFEADVEHMADFVAAYELN